MKTALISIMIVWVVIAIIATLSLMKAASKSTVKDANPSDCETTGRKSPNSNPNSSKDFQDSD